MDGLTPSGKRRPTRRIERGRSRLRGEIRERREKGSWSSTPYNGVAPNVLLKEGGEGARTYRDGVGSGMWILLRSKTYDGKENPIIVDIDGTTTKT